MNHNGTNIESRLWDAADELLSTSAYSRASMNPVQSVPTSIVIARKYYLRGSAPRARLDLSERISQRTDVRTLSLLS